MTKAKMQNVRKHIKVLILQIVCAFTLNTSKRLEKSLNKHLATCLYDDDDNDDDVNDDANDDNTMWLLIFDDWSLIQWWVIDWVNENIKCLS